MSRVRDALGVQGDVALGLATLVLAALVTVGVMSGTVAKLLDDAPTRLVRAEFADAQQLQAGNPVRIDGVASGKVRSSELSEGGRTSQVVMEVEDASGPLYQDARAVLRFKTILGGAFYVDLERGTSGTGELGDRTIPVSRTARQVELDDITPIFGGAAGRGFKTLPGELQEAFEDERAPARLLGEVAAISSDVEKGVGALRGVELDRDLRALVRNTAATTAALDRPTAELKGLVSGAAVTLQTVAARGADLQETIRRSPAASSDAVTTLRRVERTLDLADPLLADVREPAGQVAPTLAAARPVLQDADALLVRARPLLRALRPAAASLTDAAGRGLPLVEQLEPTLRRLDDVLLPMLSEKDPGTTKSTAVMIGGAVAGLASGAGGQMDANGHLIRFPATSGSSPFSSLPCQTYFDNPDKPNAVACQELSSALQTYLSYSPLTPTPGTGNGPEAGR